MSLESKIRSLKAHPLIQVLADNGGNPRTLVLIEPLWGVPYNLIAPFATLYMYTQGITDVQIGLILSVTMAVQVLFSFLGGIHYHDGGFFRMGAGLPGVGCFEQFLAVFGRCNPELL